MSVGLPEFIINASDRCPVILLVDISSSMSGEPITELYEGIKMFKANVEEDEEARLSVQVAVITFNDDVNIIKDFQDISDFEPPKLEASGGTKMGSAINKALDILEERRVMYKENAIGFYRPWVILITDGAPTDYWMDAAKRLEEAEETNKLLFYSVGVKDADMETLKKITPNRERVGKLNSLDFKSMFQFFSVSLIKVSQRKIGDKTEPPSIKNENWADKDEDFWVDKDKNEDKDWEKPIRITV